MSKGNILNNKLAIPDQYVSIKDLIDILKKGIEYYKNISPEEQTELEKLNKNQENIKSNSMKDIIDAMKKEDNTLKENKGISGIIFKEGASDYMTKGLVYLRNRLKYVEKCISSATESKDNSKLLKYQTEKGDIIAAIGAILHNKGNKQLNYKRNSVKENKNSEETNKLIESLEKLTGKKVFLKENEDIKADNNIHRSLLDYENYLEKRFGESHRLLKKFNDLKKSFKSFFVEIDKEIKK